MFTFNLSVPTVQLQPPSSSSEAFQIFQLYIEGELTLAYLGNLLTFTVELKCDQFHVLGHEFCFFGHELFYLKVGHVKHSSNKSA